MICFLFFFISIKMHHTYGTRNSCFFLYKLALSVIYSVFNTTKNYTNIRRDELCVILQILIGQFPKTRLENWFLFFFEINYFTKNWKVAFKMETVKQQWLLSWNNVVFHTHISAQKKKIIFSFTSTNVF